MSVPRAASGSATSCCSATHPAACLRYADAKRASARRWSDDGWACTEAKTGVILDILEQAEDWAVTTGWARGSRSRRPSLAIFY